MASLPLSLAWLSNLRASREALIVLFFLLKPLAALSEPCGTTRLGAPQDREAGSLVGLPGSPHQFFFPWPLWPFLLSQFFLFYYFIIILFLFVYSDLEFILHLDFYLDLD